MVSKPRLLKYLNKYNTSWGLIRRNIFDNLVVLIFTGIFFFFFALFAVIAQNRENLYPWAKYSILLKPRKLIPAKKIEKNPQISRNFPPLWQIAVVNKKCLLYLIVLFDFLFDCLFWLFILIVWCHATYLIYLIYLSSYIVTF